MDGMVSWSLVLCLFLFSVEEFLVSVVVWDLNDSHTCFVQRTIVWVLLRGGFFWGGGFSFLG